jgi:hydroxymethylbilane synthase
MSGNIVLPQFGKLRIATRRSRLALWQADHIRTRLMALYPGLQIELVPMSTRGDELLDARLDKAGGKGLFVRELEMAMIEGRADLAVHSMKDMPVELPEGFVLAAITRREDPRDAFVCAGYAHPAELPAGSSVGTSSLRRGAQLLERFPSLRIEPLQGNVETRIAKIDRGEHVAAILAAAGLRRLGLEHRIGCLLDPELSLPAAGQGALGIECAEGRADLRALLAPLGDATSRSCVLAERAVSRTLGGSCSIPLAAYAQPDPAGLRLRALVASLDGRRVLRAECVGDAADPERLGERAAQTLRERGADEVLAPFRTDV